MTNKDINEIAIKLSTYAINAAHGIACDEVLVDTLHMIQKRAIAFLEIQKNLNVMDTSRTLRLDQHGAPFLGDN